MKPFSSFSIEKLKYQLSSESQKSSFPIGQIIENETSQTSKVVALKQKHNTTVEIFLN